MLTALAERTAALGRAAGMQIGADQGALLTLLTRLVGARQAVEVGTFTGYSSICIARGLQPGGHLLCCDVSEEYTAIAKDAWAEAGLDRRIELRLAPALETLRALPADADDRPRLHRRRQGRLRRLLRRAAATASGPAGSCSSTTRCGPDGSLDDGADDDDTMAIRAFNDLVAADDRVDSYILPVGDGLTLIRKR